MKIALPYGNTVIEFELPAGADCEVVEQRHAAGLGNPGESIREALRRPIGASPLRECVRSHSTVGIVVSDVTRPTPYDVILPPLLHELSHVPAQRIVFFVANGTHRPNTTAELIDILGADVVHRHRVVQNDASDTGSHELVGRTRRGNDVWIHGEFLRCDVKILTGFIEPHFFAGFSGGGKAVMPGLSTLETIMRNHSAQNMDHPDARWGVTDGNPIWEEAREAALMTRPTFIVNVALNKHKEITAVFAGALGEAHAAGCSYVRENAMIPIATEADIVVSTNSGYPLDINLYQAVKGMSAAELAVRKGGTIVMAAECRDGIPEHGSFGSLLLRSRDPDDLLRTVQGPGFHGQDAWQAQILARIVRKANVLFYSDKLTDEQIRLAFLTPCRDISASVRELVTRSASRMKICVMPEGPQTVPVIRTQ